MQTSISETLTTLSFSMIITVSSIRYHIFEGGVILIETRGSGSLVECIVCFIEVMMQKLFFVVFHNASWMILDQKELIAASIVKSTNRE